jgi:hypothetical protein
MPGLILAVLLAQTTSPERGSLQPSSATYSIGAAGGQITIPVTRSVGSQGPVGCSYTTVDGTAIAGRDYVAKTGTLSWANGDSAAKNVVIDVLDDAAFTGSRAFTLRLHTPTGGAWLGVPVSVPVVNHEGRALGAFPGVASPTLWNTAAADAMVAALQILPANNPWNEDVSQRPVAANSDSIIDAMGRNTALALNRDMNFVVVPAAQTKKGVNLVDYPDESDPGPYPVPDNTPIENWEVDETRSFNDAQINQNPYQDEDRHAMILDPVNGYIYEFWIMRRDSGFNWTAANEATFNLNSNTLRPAGVPFGTDQGWTSADAAGLPILPSIPRYDECQRGMVEHALRFTAAVTRNQYVYPATHYASSNSGSNRPRMGERFRLKNSSRVNGIIAGMATHPKAIALALKKYGMFMADNGGNWRMSAGGDARLTNLSQLTQFIGDDFEVVVPTGPDEGPRASSNALITVSDAGGGGGDTTAPAISVTTPTAAATYSTSVTPFALGGTASDAVGVVQVTWVTGAGGSGVASGTTSWSASIPLQPGSNTITVTAQDAAGNAGADVITVDYASPPPASDPGGGGGGSGCGLLGVEALLLGLLRGRRVFGSRVVRR